MLTLVEVFDTATSVWATVTPMTTPRQYHGVAVLRGTIWAVGGNDGNANLATVETSFAGQGAWKPAANLTQPRVLFALIAIEGGAGGDMLVAAGGCDGSACAGAEAYDASTGAWAAIAAMATPRSRCVGAALGGLAYVIGGCSNANCFLEYLLSSVEVYDPATGKWAAAPAMAAPRFDHAAAALVVGGTARVYVSGSHDAPNRNTTVAFGEWFHECDASAPSGCNVCAACCNATAFPDGGACEACYDRSCPH